jgi:predicted glycosyltransferase
MRDEIRRSSPSPRVLLYSHDTFGLGHLRRSRAIAAALASAFNGLSALIITGSPVAGRFTFRHGVDHIRLPGVVKTPEGDYVAESLGMTIEETTALRASVIQAAAEDFRPNLIIVDKEATGLHGEMLPTLKKTRAAGRAKVVLGVRDILDAPEVVGPEWARKGALRAAEDYYDEIWIYGDESFYRPLQGLELSADLASRVYYTGYLRREVPNEPLAQRLERPYILVTPGGGGDGEALVEWVLRAYETDAELSPDAFIVYGPFLGGEKRAEFERRVAALEPRVSAVGFDSQIEALMLDAQGVVAMGGYNTFCELLSFDRRAIIAPRRKPRMEQYIRAAIAEERGLIRMLDRQRDGDGPNVMASAIRALTTQPSPSRHACPGMLNGLPNIVARTMCLLNLTLCR